MVDYKEKIRKLLALAESPVEAEARAALLKARQLMAEHKLTERECREAEKQAVKDVLTDITCSKRREPWIVPLSATIGESYCCKGYRKRYYGQQTQHVGFIGLEDDVEICTAVFKYAVDCIRAGGEEHQARVRRLHRLLPEVHQAGVRQLRLRFRSGHRRSFRASGRGEPGGMGPCTGDAERGHRGRAAPRA